LANISSADCECFIEK